MFSQGRRLLEALAKKQNPPAPGTGDENNTYYACVSSYCVSKFVSFYSLASLSAGQNSSKCIKSKKPSNTRPEQGLLKPRKQPIEPKKQKATTRQLPPVTNLIIEPQSQVEPSLAEGCFHYKNSFVLYSYDMILTTIINFVSRSELVKMY